MNIQTLWDNLDDGKTVYWHNTAYKIYIEEVPMHLPDYFVTKFQTKHHTFRDGKVLSVRCIENYFGGLISELEMNALYLDGNTAPVVPDQLVEFGKQL